MTLLGRLLTDSTHNCRVACHLARPCYCTWLGSRDRRAWGEAGASSQGGHCWSRCRPLTGESGSLLQIVRVLPLACRACRTWRWRHRCRGCGSRIRWRWRHLAHRHPVRLRQLLLEVLDVHPSFSQRFLKLSLPSLICHQLVSQSPRRYPTNDS